MESLVMNFISSPNILINTQSLIIYKKHLKWILDQNLVVSSQHNITKRSPEKFEDGFLQGAAVGSILGPLGSLIGGIGGGLLCIELCEGT